MKYFVSDMDCTYVKMERTYFYLLLINIGYPSPRNMEIYISVFKCFDAKTIKKHSHSYNFAKVDLESFFSFVNFPQRET